MIPENLGAQLVNVGRLARPPTPGKGLILEATRNGINEKGLPVFSVSQILGVPADRELMVPIIRGLNPSHRSEPMKVLHEGRRIIVPDYRFGGYVTQDNTRFSDAEMERLAGAIGTQAIDYRLKQLKRGKTAITQAVVEKTSKGIRERIKDLVGPEHQIKRTFRVGKVQATEVVPVRKIDPLYCVRLSDSRLDGTMNRLFEVAFVRAMAGRLDSNLRALIQAAELGEVAGRTAINSCFGGAGWSLGELLFVSEIVYSDGQYLTNGFARLQL